MSSIPSIPHGQANKSRGGDTCGELLLGGGQLAVGGRGRMDDQRADVADVGHVAVQSQRVHELLARVHTAGDLEGDDRTLSLGGGEFLAALVPGRGLEAGVGDGLTCA